LSAALLQKSIRGWWSSLGRVKGWLARAGWFEKCISLVTLVLLLLALSTAVAPPLKFDALSYHLAIPRSYLLEGRIIYLPDNMFWGMPQEMESLFTLVTLFGGVEAAPLLGWLMGGLALAGIFDFTAHRFNRAAAYAACASLLAGETLAASLGWGYVEWPLMLFGAATSFLLVAWLEKPDLRLAALGGILAGMSLSIKYTAGIVLLCSLVVLAASFSRVGLRKGIFSLLVFGACACLAMTPWLAKNALATGNPFYPLLFPSGAMDSTRLHFYQDVPIYKDWKEVVLLPWQATIWGVEGKSGYSASIGPLLLGLGALFWIGWRTRPVSQRNALTVAAWMTLTGLAGWAIASRFSGLLIQSRLYMGIFPAWALLSGAGFDALQRLEVRRVRFGRIAKVLILLPLVFNLFETGSGWLDNRPLEVIAAFQTRAEYIAAQTGSYGPAMEGIASLPDGSKVVMLWEPREYYCLPRCDGDEIIDRWYHETHTHPDALSVIESWKAEGYTHLLLNAFGAEYVEQETAMFDRRDWEMLEDLLSLLPLPEAYGQSYLLYPLP
ncbi:MAG: glycosyltransferase family 39 protein, partial [Chloroflexi bacterium]|nr:glycosyltransferase family 39 protein [Chloroflexota bacterium]